MENHQTSHCPVCGEALPENAALGLCPKCLLREAAAPDSSSYTSPMAGMPPSPSLEQLAEHFPQWEIQEILGRGGMGTVYKIRQPLLDRSVAIKILPVELAQTIGFAERFAQEARLRAKLSHPNIVNIHDFGQAGPYFYVLMEYVDGVNLRQAMESGTFSEGQSLAIVRAMCDALEYAHAEGVVHRDIKPENILLDAAGRVKLVDFGIGKLASALKPGAPYLTATGDGLGTPHYMAPEQIERARDVDHRADIYSLGVVFYELLTGELPLGRFPAPSERAAVDPGIDPVVMKALERQREKRHQDAAEMRTEVERATVVATPPEPVVQRSNPWMNRGLTLTITAIVAFCVLIGLSKKNMHDGDRLNTLQNAASVRQVEANQDFEFVQARIQAGLVPQRGEEERQVRAAKDKADDEFRRFQEQRAELTRPSVFWWVFVAIAVLGFFGGCACGWVALVLIHRHELLAGKGRAVTSALLVPVIGLGLFIESTVRGFIDHMQWKNEELIHNVARLFIVLGWMMATVWLTATVMRWARRETPVAARLNRTFVLGTTGLSGILLLVFFVEKI